MEIVFPCGIGPWVDFSDESLVLNPYGWYS